MTMDNITCGQRDALLAYLYGESDGTERARFEAHLAGCAGCRRELEGFRALRTGLAAWMPPERDLGFTIVSRGEPARARWWSRPAWGLAAAAVLVFAVAAAVAHVEVRYGADGLTVRTGWTRDADANVGPDPNVGPAVESGVGRTAVGSGLSRTLQEAAWRADLTALEQRLRRDLRDGRSEAAPAQPSRAAQDVLQRVRTLIGESETRQQRELALRIAQLAHDFDRQRQTDLVRIQNGFGQLEGTTAADRELLNYLAVRVSQRQ
jgi:hypothetical protein